MKKLFSSLLLVCVVIFTPCIGAKELDSLVKELRDKNISAETLAALVQLNKPALKAGYGFCSAAGRPFCKPNGSLGYGLCELAGGQLCKEDGSLGYGLCMLGGEFNCHAKGSLGYGMCRLSGVLNCKP